jgi:hypothetical protein
MSTLRHLLADHTATPTEPDGPKSSANCVHVEGYGTRSSCIVRWEEDPSVRPQVWVADGPPCTAPFVDVSAGWSPATPPR